MKREAYVALLILGLVIFVAVAIGYCVGSSRQTGREVIGVCRLVVYPSAQVCNLECGDKTLIQNPGCTAAQLLAAGPPVIREAPAPAPNPEPRQPDLSTPPPAPAESAK